MPERGKILPIGKGRVIREGNRVAILSLGHAPGESLKAAEELEKLGLSTTVADARFAKPLDLDLIRKLADTHEVLLTIEEGSRGASAPWCCMLWPKKACSMAASPCAR